MTVRMEIWIDVLVVGDGIVHFGPKDLTDANFTIAHFLDALAAHNSPRIRVATAHRRDDANAHFQNFNFATSVSLEKFDVIWMFGYEGSNEGFVNPMQSALSELEIAAIATFMQKGGGVFATGDHAGLGSFMCGLIPRVRSMRKWFDADGGAPPGYPTNWSAFGPERADTTQPDAMAQFWFDNQSDDLPQPLTIPGGLANAHAILQGPQGVLTQYPDHMHEGEVIVPWTLGDTLSYAGKSFVEYPILNGYQEVPQIIATGAVLGNHETLLEGNDQMQFVGAAGFAVPKTIGVLCAYDGRKVKVGRVVTDSSFHHELDLNLTGDPLGVAGVKQMGFTTAAGAPILDALDAFYCRTAIWLAKSLHFWVFIDYYLTLPWWWELFNPGGPVEIDPSKVLQYGVLVRQELTRGVGDGIAMGWVHEALRDVGIALPEGRGAGRAGPAQAQRHADDIVAAALGGAVLEMMRAKGSAAAGPLGDKAQDAARRGLVAGLHGLAKLIAQRNKEDDALAARLLKAAP